MNRNPWSSTPFGQDRRGRLAPNLGPPASGKGGPATGLEPAIDQRNDAWVLPFPITSALCAKMKRRPMPAGASGSMRHAPSQALAEDYRDSDRQNQARPLISEDGQPVSGRVGLPRSSPP